MASYPLSIFHKHLILLELTISSQINFFIVVKEKFSLQGVKRDYRKM
ncbi:hypothetical protein LCGC14_1066870 [marine sediment metagenome]|uniref:Uncharacterized protein n=1 Tax=marine sediment metagenome TaxID=412755 RepID=A0A0F9QQ71_9ZZZZ